MIEDNAEVIGCAVGAITCDALSSTRDKYAFAVFERASKDFGLPIAIRSDNGLPFAPPHALYGLSCLSEWWLRVAIERIKPGHPEQNGPLTSAVRHEQPAQRIQLHAFTHCYGHRRPDAEV